MNSRKCIEISNGCKRAVFLDDGDGWRPDWFYEDDRPVLRFKDHEWLSLGHIRPLHASAAVHGDGGRGLFSGCTAYGTTVSAIWPGDRVTRTDVHVEPRATQVLTMKHERD